MDFWNTIRGVELAEILIQSLPLMLEQNAAKQEVIEVEQEKSFEVIKFYLEDNYKLIQAVPSKEGKLAIVFEKVVKP